MSEKLRKLHRLSRTCFDLAASDSGKESAVVKDGYLKMLLHGRCSFDCAYCGICRMENAPSFAPKELSDLICSLWRSGRINGLFLSTGIPRDCGQSMEDLIETATLLRLGGFGGYLHLKVVPGALRTDINEAARLANRISINLEAVGKDRLSEIASVKNYESDLLRRHAWVAEAAPGRHTTQIVVGAAGETDGEILSFMDREYRRFAPASIYYSGLIPLLGTPLADAAPASPARVRGLYGVDALIRGYGYSLNDLMDALDNGGMLKPGDPKINSAKSVRIDPMLGSREELIRILGIGPNSADQILLFRRERPMTQQLLKEAGVVLRRALPHLIINGSTQARLL